MTDGRMPRTAGGRSVRALVVLGAALAASVLVGHDLGTVGLTWDEPGYMEAAHRIEGWAAGVVQGPDRRASFSADSIRSVFDWHHYWNPHPPAYREAMAVTGALFGHVLGRQAGYRLASLLWFVGLVGLVAWVACREWGPLGGAGAALALLLTPRLVGQAHIAATDTPLTFAWVLGTVGWALYLRDGSRAWGLLGALGFGLAMATKFTGYLLPAPLAAWVLLEVRSWRRIAVGVVLVVAALAVAWALNPLAWYHPIGYVEQLFHESLDRATTIPITTYYLGRAWGYVVPWHHPIVMTLATMPLPLLVLAGWGSATCFSRQVLRKEALALLCLIQVGFFWVLLALPSSPNHDGVRLFLPMFPFVGLLAGRGLTALLGAVERVVPGRRVAAAAVALALFFFPPLLQEADAAPLYLAYYGELIGGARGADRRGLEATYWYDAITPGFLRAVDRALPRDARLVTLPMQDHFIDLQTYGQLRKDIRISGRFPEPYILLYARKAMFGPDAWKLYRNVRPVIAVRYQGVVLVGLYTWDREAATRLRAAP
jgi:hypothetical protein